MKKILLFYIVLSNLQASDTQFNNAHSLKAAALSNQATHMFLKNENLLVQDSNPTEQHIDSSLKSIVGTKKTQKVVIKKESIGEKIVKITYSDGSIKFIE